MKNCGIMVKIKIQSGSVFLKKIVKREVGKI